MEMHDSGAQVARPAGASPARVQATRDSILDTAMRRFARDGFAAVSMRALANQVGVTKPALYYHFTSKEALFQAALQSIVDEFARVSLAGISDDDPLPAKLERYLGNVFTGVTRAPYKVQFFVRFAVFAFPNEVPVHAGDTARSFRDAAREHLQPVAIWLAQAQRAGAIPAGVDLGELFMSFIGVMYVRIMHAAYDSAYSLSVATAHELSAQFLRGFGYRHG